MKKIFFLLIALLASLMTYAYDVTNFFTAYSADGKYYLLDSVKIDNVTQGWSRTIDCSADTSVNYSVQPTSPTGIDDVMASSSENGLISDYRNYLSSHRFAVNIDHAGLLSIRAIDMLGRTLVRHDEYCAEGSYHFQMSLSQTQPFILSVTTANASEALMLLNTSNTGYNSIACENREPIRHAPLQQESEYKLCEGDKINYTGYSHRQGQVIVSQVVSIYLRLTDELIFFIFQSAIHSNEGSYVGLIGFNNQLYSKQIGLLTGSNLSQYTSFIDNLSTANGTILAHAVNGALDSLELSPIPTKLNDVTLVTFTDGLDVGSWRMNKDYSSSAQYLQAVSNRIGKTYIDGSLLTSYAIGIKGSDVTDEERFDNDLKNLASDPSYVFNVKDMTEVRRKFRDIAAKIYHTYISYSLLLSLPAPDPDSRIRLTFDNINDAAQSEYYLEGTYTFGDYGVLNNVSYCGVRCTNGSTLVSYPDGMFDIFVLHNLETNLGERIVASNVKQWYYIPSTGKWQINSEFTPASGVTVTEDRNSAIIMLVLDCSSSLSSNFSSIKSYAKEFLNVLAGKTTFSKPSVSASAPILGKLSATCGGKITDDKGMSILEKGICFSENGNMDNAVYYPAGSGSDEFDVVVDGLEEGKTYYYHAYARNEVGTAYSTRQQFVAIDYHIPTVQTGKISSIKTHSASFEGKIIFNGYAPITECGFCWSTSSNPTLDDNTLVLEATTGTFSGNVTELQDGTTYYVRAYAKNESGVGYGEELSFTTIAILPPTVSLLSTTIMAANYGAQCQGKVTNDGNAPIIECGFCWGTSPNPTIEDNYIETEYNSYKFIANILDLLVNTDYHVRAYAKNEKEIGYSEEDLTKNIYISAITYTATQKLNEVINDDEFGLHVNNFGTTIQLHEFYNDTGVVVFSKKCINIGDYAFYGCENLTSVDIPKSITRIGRSAFNSCTSLSSIDIPNSVTSIEGYSFSYCRSLVSINIDSENLKYCYIDGVIYNKEKSTLISCLMQKTGEYIIPYNITNIGVGAFCGCEKLTSVTIPDGVINIEEGAFYDCKGITSIEIPNSITNIGNQAFKGSIALTDVYLSANPENLTWSDKGCDDFICSPKKSTLCHVPTEYIIEYGSKWSQGNDETDVNVTFVSEPWLTGDCKAILSGTGELTISGLGKMDDYIDPATQPWNRFLNDIVSVVIEDGVSRIGDGAFSGCKNLTSIEIPNSVANIGNYAFNGCNNLISVTINSDSIVSKKYTSSYNLSSIFGKQVKKYVLDDKITSIGDSAFYECINLSFVSIGNSVTNIGNCAFKGCDNLTNVTINSDTIVRNKNYTSSFLNRIFGKQVKECILGNKITRIGNFAFYSCENLIAITISNSVTDIGNNAFRDCSNLTSVTIPNSVISIGTEAFRYCKSLTSIEIPNSVTSIESFAFMGCSSLASITIGNSVTSIGSDAFSWCSSLKSIEIPNSVTSIGSWAFQLCSRLKTVALPNSVTSIGRSTFENCYSLTSIEIPNSVTSIGDNAFRNCSSLSSVIIGNSVKNIGEYAFEYCRSLKSVTCKAQRPPTCERGVFYDDDNKQSSIILYVPSQSVNAYRSAYIWKDFTNIKGI